MPLHTAATRLVHEGNLACHFPAQMPNVHQSHARLPARFRKNNSAILVNSLARAVAAKTAETQLLNDQLQIKSAGVIQAHIYEPHRPCAVASNRALWHRQSSCAVKLRQPACSHARKTISSARALGCLVYVRHTPEQQVCILNTTYKRQISADRIEFELFPRPVA